MTMASAVLAVPGNAAAAAGEPLEWVHLGDSYSAGVGLGFIDPPCDRDLGNYGQLTADAVATPVSFSDYACSGATTGAYWVPQHDGVQQQRLNITPDTDVVTMTFGGNDISFASKIYGCLLGDCGPDVWELSAGNSGGSSFCFIDLGCEGPNGSTWDNIYARLVAIYADAREQMDPDGHLYVLSYPMPFSLGNSCVAGVSNDEMLAINALTTRLGDVIYLAAQEANNQVGNVHFVDWRTGNRIENLYEVPPGYDNSGERFAVHASPDGLCNDVGNAPLLNAFSLTSKIGGGFGFDNSFHPTSAGYEVAALRLVEAVNEHSIPDDPPLAPSATHLLTASCPLMENNGPTFSDDVLSGNVVEACNLGVTVEAVIIRIRVEDPVAEGNLRIGPSGGPLSGVVNFGANGLNNSASMTVPVSSAGAVKVSINGGSAPSGTLMSHGVDVDIVGWVGQSTEDGLAYHPVTSCAFFDSRINQGSTGPGPFVIGENGAEASAILVGSFDPGQGGGNTNCGVPLGAKAARVNYVIIQPSGQVHLSADQLEQLGSSQPLNAPFNNSIATVVPVSDAGAVSFSFGGETGAGTHLRAQVLGYYEDESVPGGLRFVATDPCVVLDSRPNQGASLGFAGPRNGGSTTTYDVVGTFDAAQGGGSSDCGIPVEAEAIEINFVGVNALAEGNLKVSATGTVSSGGVLNFGALVPKMNNSNAVVVPVSADGEIDLFMNGGPQGVGSPIADVRGTVTGYYVPSG